MPILSQEDARNFIAQLREDNGGITPEDREFLIANRPSALRALKNSRRQLADSIKILVDNLYSKETRFLYELIQNAEDNSYSTATADGEKPFLAFKLYPGRIIIDSNEDGFSEKDIKSICTVGKSTKEPGAGYIGEKGIGFKSVFKIAQKVHIQSGPFTFAFSHTREDDDDGLGMITPYDEDAEELPIGVRTRMAFTLLDSIKFEELASEFQHVPDTFLMFLTRLQRLSVELYQPEHSHTATQYSKRETKENGLHTTLLAKTTRNGKEESTSEQKYYTMKSELQDLPFDEARKDKEGRSIDRATVILGFPVDEHDEPVLKEQYTYAFLPLRRVGFKFLIQADFVTQANREDVVHSKRNQAVLEGVAKACADAVIVLCKHPSLRYRWMRYLPGESISDDFWKSLWTLLCKKLEQSPILEPWSGNGLYKPSNLEKLSEICVAEDGSPLLPDLEGAEIYLSPKYTEADFEILRRLGTTKLKFFKFVDRLDADLRILGGSKWRDLQNNADWRTRICKLLLLAFSRGLSNEQKHLRTLPLIPLHDGRWVSSASETKIYFPKTGDIPIPEDLGLDIVHPMAADNESWVDLLLALDVISCSQDSVISSIYKYYNATNIDNFKVVNAVAHMRYLYWFPPKDHFILDSKVRLANQHGSLLKKDQYLYFFDERDDYSPSKLFGQYGQLPGHPVHYLHEDYLKAVDPEIIHHGLRWMTWLEKRVGVRQLPELRATGRNGLSKEFQYIINYQSNRLLGTLKRGWAFYRARCPYNGVAEEELRRSAVLLENGRRKPLLRTFLPLPKLKQIAAELCIVDTYPFIAISELLRDEERLEWMFVKDLQVGIEENLEFYLTALETFQQTDPGLSTPFGGYSAGKPLTRIYQNIQSRFSESVDRVRDVFMHSVIWIPPSNRIDSSWLSAADCIWEGPQWLESKQCLKLEIYRELEPLFKLSLRIPDASQIDVFNDLLMLKSYGGDKIAFRSQATTHTQPNIGTTRAQYQVTSDPFNPTDKFQSITSMEAYQKHSFEELRLEDYGAGRKPLSTKTSVHKSKAFAGLETKKIIEEAEKRYQYLWENNSFAKDGEKVKALRFAFENSALVYIPKENAWCAPSQCVWVESNIKIPGKVSIADAYPSLEAFFIKILNISKPTVNMYVESLKAEAAKDKGSTTLIKETMKLICSLGVGENDFSSLIEAKVLPVKLANGLGSFASASSKNEGVEFAIVENNIHWEAFKSRIVVLDFSLEEIRDTRPLLLALGLEERFSSILVKEVTDVNGGSQDREMTKNFRIKSQAIVRCAFHFAILNKRQDVATLYRKFKRAVVYVSDGIRRSLQIMQGGRSIESASSRADFHFEEAEGALRLYLPKHEADRDVCLEFDLPRRLCTFLGITDPGASGLIGGIFRKDNPVVIDRILEKAGVSQNDCDFTALDEEVGTSEAQSDVATLVEATNNIRLPSSSPDPHSHTPSGWARGRERHSRGEDVEDVRDEIIPSSPYQDRQRQAQETAYKCILENVVSAARQRVTSHVFESTGSFNKGSVATEALPQEVIRTAFPTRTQERDFKVGAAGELYMFEIFKGLGLPGFGLENWKSEIRDRVNIHADYHDLGNCNDRSAIADFEYQDNSGNLTDFLIQKLHLPQGFWCSKTLTYHIEIKTTTSSNWQESFFMSKFQERHIRDKRIEDGKWCSRIYMICRIFNIGKGDETGMQIYLDPETKRRKGELEFSTHTWAVKPLTHPSIQVEDGMNRASAARTTDTTATTAKKSDDTGTDGARKQLGVPSFANLGSSATSSVSTSSDWASGSSMIEFQKRMKTLGSSMFNSNSAPFSSNNASTESPPSSTSFGTTNSSSTTAIFSDFNSVSPSNDVSKALSLGLAGSNPTSSASDVSKARAKGGLFGSDAMFASDPPAESSSMGLLFGAAEAPKVTFPISTGFSGFDSPSSTISEAPSASGAFGQKPSSRTVKPRILHRRQKTKSSPSVITGEILRTNPPPSETQTRNPAAGTLTAAVQPSSSSTASFTFGTVAQPSSPTATSSTSGTAVPSTESGPSKSMNSFSVSGTSSSTSRSVSGANTTSTSHNPFGFPTSPPTASNLSSASKESSNSTTFGSTNTTETASTTKPTTPTAPSFFTAGPAPTDNPFLSSFQANNWLNRNSQPVNRSLSPSTVPTKRPCSPQAQEVTRATSPQPAVTEAKVLFIEKRPAATGDIANDETQTDD